MVISIIMLVLCVAGIIAAWAYNTPLTETLLGFVVPATNIAQRVETVASETGGTLDDVSALLGDAEAKVAEIGGEVLDTEIVVEAISAILGEDVRPLLEEAVASFRAVYDLIGTVEEAINTFNSIPLVGLEVPGTEELAQVRTGMEEFATEVDALNEDLQQRKTEIVTGAVEEISAPINRLGTQVSEIRSDVGEIETRAGAAHERLILIQDRLPFWIDLISIVITVLLLWIIISQVAMFVLCRKTLQGKVA
jgi:methyl-accepting chemotaxis protein